MSPFQTNNIKPMRQIGFTLIEILIAITIISIFAAGIGLSLFGNVDKALVTRAQQDIQQLESALDIYRLDNFRYPSQAAGLNALVTRPAEARGWSGPYIKSLPKDPWGSDYQYRNPGTKGQQIDIFSFGADSAEGGGELNADIGNWTQ